MAYTVTKVQSVFGNERVVHMDVTADAATQTIETGLKNVFSISTCLASCNTAIRFAINSNSSGIASFGVVAVSGATSGDRIFITVYGA